MSKARELAHEKAMLESGIQLFHAMCLGYRVMARNHYGGHELLITSYPHLPKSQVSQYCDGTETGLCVRRNFGYGESAVIPLLPEYQLRWIWSILKNSNDFGLHTPESPGNWIKGKKAKPFWSWR